LLTIVVIVLAVLLASLLVLFVHRERSKAGSRRASSIDPAQHHRGLLAVPNPAFARHGVRPDDGGYGAGSNQTYAEPSPVYLEPTPVVESHA